MSRILFILNVLLLTPSNLHVYVITALVYSVCCSLCPCVLPLPPWTLKVVSLLFSTKRDIDSRLTDLQQS